MISSAAIRTLSWRESIVEERAGRTLFAGVAYDGDGWLAVHVDCGADSVRTAGGWGSARRTVPDAELRDALLRKVPAELLPCEDDRDGGIAEAGVCWWPAGAPWGGGAGDANGTGCGQSARCGDLAMSEGNETPGTGSYEVGDQYFGISSCPCCTVGTKDCWGD